MSAIEFDCSVCGRGTVAREGSIRAEEKVCISCSLLITQNKQIRAWWNELLPEKLKKEQMPSTFPINKKWEDLSYDQVVEVAKFYLKGGTKLPDGYGFRDRNTPDQDEQLKRMK